MALATFAFAATACFTRVNHGLIPSDGCVERSVTDMEAMSDSSIPSRSWRQSSFSLAYLGGRVPQYPAELRRTGQEGRVIARFIIDKTGRVLPGTVEIVDFTHRQFRDALCYAFEDMRYKPMIVHDSASAVRVESKFEFVLGR
jgi:TonB family protein